MYSYRGTYPMAFRSLINKHVVVTGGSRGIGLACAKRFWIEGSCVTLIARDGKRLEEARNAILSEKQRDVAAGLPSVNVKKCDVSDPDEVKKAIESIFEDRPIDILICNAGIVRTAYFEESNLKDIKDQIQTNLMGTIFPIHLALPLMKKRSKENPGAIVIMSSLSGLSHWYGAATYTATKYAQKGLAETLRLELIDCNIKIHLICPNFTETPFLEDATSSDEKFNKRMKIACAFNPKKLEKADHIADCTVQAVKKGTFLTTTQNPLGGFLKVLSRGLIPPETFLGCLTEVLLAGPARFLSILASNDMFNSLKKALKE